MKVRIALAQVNPTVGDIDGNASVMADAVKSAQAQGAGIVAFPELSICGYPPEDLIFSRDFIVRQRDAIENLARLARKAVVIAGFAEEEDGKIYNSAAVMREGRIAAVYRKAALPNYGVFDEKRYFTPGGKATVLRTGRTSAAVNICEDIWVDGGVAETQSLAGDACLIINISSSPFHAGKSVDRRKLVSGRARDLRCFLAYVNLVGGQDELVFDGGSMIASPDGSMLCRAGFFATDMLLADVNLDEALKLRRDPEFAARQSSFKPAWPVPAVNLGPIPDSRIALKPRAAPAEPKSPEEEIYGALVLGTRDYACKNGFTDAVLGLSGGVDSALTAVVAVDALGPSRVHGVAMPSRYSSRGSLEDARALASNAGIDLLEISIEKPFGAYLEVFSGIFAGLKQDETEENIQARIRGNLLMALSNKHDWLVLTTGNKSEISVGYSTLYGDTAGGFAVIKDVFKTMVYRLVDFRNAKGQVPVIARSIIEKPPSAELKPGQTDQDTLPPYDVLDSILRSYIELNLPPSEIAAAHRDSSLVRKVVGMVERSEFKRRQSPPGVKITPLSFGRDRRMPVTNRFRA